MHVEAIAAIWAGMKAPNQTLIWTKHPDWIPLPNPEWLICGVQESTYEDKSIHNGFIMYLLCMRLSFNIFEFNFVCSDFHSMYSDFQSINSKKTSLQHILCIFEILMWVKLMTMQCHEIGQYRRWK